MKRRLIRLAVVVAALLVVLVVPTSSEEACFTDFYCHISACGVNGGVGYEIHICIDTQTGHVTRQSVTFLGCGC